MDMSPRTQDPSNEMRFLMRMAPSATFDTVVGICQELNGLIPGMPRFKGACDPLQVWGGCVPLVQLLVVPCPPHLA